MLKQKNFLEANIYFTKCQKLEPEIVDFYEYWGMTLLELGHFDLAIEKFENYNF